MFSLQHRERIKANTENIEKLKVGTIGNVFAYSTLEIVFIMCTVLG